MSDLYIRYRLTNGYRVIQTVFGIRAAFYNFYPISHCYRFV